MKSFIALLAFLHTAGVTVEQVKVPAPDGTQLDAALVLPSGPIKPPAVVAMHGCGGPFATRDGSWAVALAQAGHIVILPDSFGSRGLGSQCGVKAEARAVTPEHLRRDDAIAAGEFLAQRPDTPSGGLALIGWSNGGGTVLAAARVAPDLPPGLFRRFAAFYPGCKTPAHDSDWRPSAPIMILVGEDDDWTPAPPCHDLAARFPDQITLVTYPGAYHDFDAPDRPVSVRDGAATAHNGQAHAGTNEPARQDALQRVPPFLEAR